MHKPAVAGIHQVALKATDLDRAEAFYREHLGLVTLARFDPPGLLFMDLGGGSRLLLDANATSGLVYLRCPDLQARMAALEAAGVEVAQAPHAVLADDDGLFGPPGGVEWLGFIRDSEGNMVGLAERAPGKPPAN